MNLFRYVNDDPVSGSDPTGLQEPGPIPDRIWELARYADPSNIFQGSFGEYMNRRQAGLEGAGDGGSSKSAAAESEGKKTPPMQRVPSFIRREATSFFKPYKAKDGRTLYRAHTVWTLTLLDENQQPTFGAGIRVNERIAHSNAVSYAGSGERRSGYDTQPGGWVKDPWSLSFSSLDGKITTHQTVIVDGREAKWDATTNARGEVEEGSQHWAPFR